jgi:hypothetical protein
VEAVGFPFRLVVRADGGEARPVSLDGRAVAFSAAEATEAFIASRGAGGLGVVLVGRAMAPALAARLSGWGLCGLRRSEGRTDFHGPAPRDTLDSRPRAAPSFYRAGKERTPPRSSGMMTR